MIRILMEGMSRNLGGLEKFIKTVYDALDPNKYQIDFLVYDDSIPYEQKLLDNGSHIYRVTPRSKGAKKSKKELDVLFQKEHFDIFWSNRTMISNINALVSAKKHSVPTRIIYSHASQNMGSFFTLCMHTLNKLRIKKVANKFAACSKVAGEWFFGKNLENVSIIKNGIAISDYIYSPEREKAMRVALGLKEDTFVVTHIGRFSPEKNHKFLFEIFVEILKLNPNSVLLLCGDGDLRPELENQAKKLDIEQQIRFLGIRNDIPEILQCTDVFILPSLFEGFGIVLVESQAAGVMSFTSETVVPKDVQITELLHYLPLEESPYFWAKQILNKSKYIKKDRSEELNHAGITVESMMENIQRLLLS